MPKHFILTVALLFLTISCTRKKEDVFLKKFAVLNEMPSTAFLKGRSFIKNDTIPEKDLITVFLLDANNFKYNTGFHKNNYYYFGKYKLDTTHYLIGYFRYSDVFDESVLVYGIYDTEIKIITSKLIFESWNGGINRQTEYKEGIFYIKTFYNRIPNGQDPAPWQPQYRQKDFTEKYKINRNFIFEKIK